MIISHIIGGLGNQMFQYAAGRALALRQHQPLRLDVSGFANYGLHQGFELQRIFDCKTEIASDVDVRSVLGWQANARIRNLLARPKLRKLRSSHFVIEPHFQYWEGVHKLEPPCYLMGYWQSERYFEDAIQAIRADFSFRIPVSGMNLQLSREIAAVNAVSLHVRRGDYASNPKTLATHGMCSLEYYEAAIHHIAKNVDSPHFFIFSDDIEWVKKNLNIEYPCTYVDHNRGEESYNDMRLMSLCRHHIIANSSFSWWGAWLNQNADKIVVAPQRWFANQTDVQDLLPQSWVHL